MEKIVITGRIFEKILTNSGFSKADFARHVSKNGNKRSRQWASHLILLHSSVGMPERWVKELKELVEDKTFEEQLKMITKQPNHLNDNGRKKHTYSVKEFAAMVKAGTLPPRNRHQAQKNIRSVFNNKGISEEEFIEKVKEMH